MVIPLKRAELIEDLKSKILHLHTFNQLNNKVLNSNLGSIVHAFPNSSFPLGAIHEFVSDRTEDIAATSGFVAGILSSLMGGSGKALWISAKRKLFPPALTSFGLSPDRFIFIDLAKEKDVLWAMDEALKCSALSVVVGEMQEISFTGSRRLQLAVEKSQVTGFLLRSNFKNINPTACVSRWKITSIPSEQIDNLPGIGFPKWRVELTRVRNGKAGSWDLAWINGRFAPIYKFQPDIEELQRRAG